MILLTDNEIVEGLIGGVAWLLLMYQVKQLLLGQTTSSVYFVSIVMWLAFWYIRKMGMNLYKDYKKRHQISDDQIVVNLDSDLPLIVFSVVLAIMLYYFGREYEFGRNDVYLIGAMLFALVILFLT